MRVKLRPDERIVTKTVCMQEATHDRAVLIAEAQRCSTSYVMRTAIELGLTAIEKTATSRTQRKSS